MMPTGCATLGGMIRLIMEVPALHVMEGQTDRFKFHIGTWVALPSGRIKALNELLDLYLIIEPKSEKTLIAPLAARTFHICGTKCKQVSSKAKT
jgi:poly(3-hydroxyalkanoate) synthetase